MAHQGTAAVADGMLDGDKLYQLRARQALPLLVRNALAQKPISYSQLSEELGMTNPRNMNFVLGSIGTTLDNLALDWGEAIPPIQSLAIGKNSGLPGEGFFKGFTKLSTPTKQMREAAINQFYGEVYGYPDWLRVLSELGLKEADSRNASTAVEIARTMRGGGESEAHRRLKDRVYNDPSLAGCSFVPTVREREFPLPSGDRIYVYFECGNNQLAVEVKPSTSSVGDIARGLFQCVKYDVILNKWRAWQCKQIEIQVVLVLGKQLPPSLKGLRNTLQVNVIDNLDDQ